MPFASIVGHEQPVRALRRAVSSGRLPPGYLFVGPPHIGKTTLALALAQAANCEQPVGQGETLDACGQCDTCRKITAGLHPDIRLVQPRLRIELPKEKKKSERKGSARQRIAQVSDEEEEIADEEPEAISADMEDALIDLELITDLVGEAARTAFGAQHRIYIIARAEAMNAAGANRLLKTLEEPPENATFVLATSRPSALLPTIISRCQTLALHALPPQEMEAALAEASPDLSPTERSAVISMSAGAWGRARRLLDRRQLLDLRAEILTLLASLPRRELWEAMRLAEALAEMTERWWLTEEPGDLGKRMLKAARDRVLRTELGQILGLLSSWFRDLIVVQADGRLINADYREQLAASAASYPPDAALAACRALDDLRADLRQNLNLRLALETLFLRLLLLRRQ